MPPPLSQAAQSGLTQFCQVPMNHYMIFNYYLIASKWMSILSATAIYIYILQVTVKITTKREPPEPRFQKLVTGL